MKSTILATKLHQPAPPSRRIERPNLIQRLNEGLEAGRPLALISAPAGFGKTTCASEWLGSVPLPSAWLSLDLADNDPGRFFLYFIAALQKMVPHLGREVESILDSGQFPPVENFTAALLNDILSAGSRFILVLDDFHLIQDSTILEVMRKLVANPPAPLHLVLVTREDPPLPLARLRANNQMTEIRAVDLRFSDSETGRFLNGLMELRLSESDITALENRTEGWIVGLQLAGLSMRGRPDPSSFIAALSGSHRYYLSYLTEEVLGRQPAEIQDFLLQTSILEKLSGDLCDAVTGRADSAALLERLYSANLFLIPLDDEQRWYRYHHLFTDLLRSQQNRLHKEQAALLHQRASRWYEEASQPGEAIEHALAAADYARAVQLIERSAMPTLVQGYAKTVENWMRDIPPEWRSYSPKANLAFAWLHLLRGNYERIPPYLKAAEAAIARAGDSGEDGLLRAEWYALQSNLLNVQGKPAESIEMAQRAIQALAIPALAIQARAIPAAGPQDVFILSQAYLGLGSAYRLAGDYPHLVEAFQQAVHYSRASGNILAEMLAVSAMTLMAIQHGQLRFAAEVGSQAIERIEQSGANPPPIAGTVYGSLSIIYQEWNQLEKARGCYQRAEQLSALVGHNAGLVFARVILSRLLQAGGDLAGAARAIQEAADLLRFGVPAWIKPEVTHQQVRLNLAQENPAAAEAALRQAGVSPQDAPALLSGPAAEGAQSFPASLLALACLRLLAYRGQRGSPEDLAAGMELAGRFIASTTASGRVGMALQALLLRAAMHKALGSAEAGLEDIAAALALAEPEGYIRLFVDEGPCMSADLAEILQRVQRGQPPTAQPAYLQQLLAAFPAAAFPTPSAAEPQGQTALVDPLTERELEVLRLIASGLKYEEIAARLVITINTVRFYVKEIYSKLNVNNRTKAIALARQLKLIG